MWSTVWSAQFNIVKHSVKTAQINIVEHSVKRPI